jgi:hypothetical protein
MSPTQDRQLKNPHLLHPLLNSPVGQPSTTKGSSTKDKRGRGACPANVQDLSEAARDVSLPGSSTSSLYRGQDYHEIQDTPRPDINHSHLFNSLRGGRLKTSSSLTQKMTSIQNKLLVKTIQNLVKEI